jgi:hypothetical protein
VKHLRHFLLLLFSTLFIFIFYSETNAEDTHYSSEERFTVFFPDKWFQYLPENIENFSSEDRENLISSFYTSDGKTFLHIKKFDKNHPFYSSYISAKSYKETTETETFKEERLYRSLETLIGEKITRYTADFEKETIFYETEKITSKSKNYKIFSFWKLQNDFIYEFHFIVYDSFSSYSEKIDSITSLIKFNFNSGDSTIPTMDHQKILLDSSKENSELNNFLKVVFSDKFPIILISILASIVLFIIIRFIFFRY